MKSISSTLLALFMIIAGSLSAQDSKVQILNATQLAKIDLTGKWSGKRHQYAADRKSFVETYQYSFDLKQEGDIVTGTSTIISSNGDYADMKLEGVVIGNKFHFREYEIKSAIRPDGKVWCFKSGELQIAKEGDQIKFKGSTPSYMEVYNYPCSGGVTDIAKEDNSNINLADLVITPGNAGVADDKIAISTFPNPFVDNTNISYTLPVDSKVSLEVYDITGKLATRLFDGNQNAGSYNLNFTTKNYNSASGIFVVKMTVNGEIYSRQLVQMK